MTAPDVEEYTYMITEECPDEDDEESMDQYLIAELILSLGTDGERVGRVIKRSQMALQKEGHQFWVLCEITDHRKDESAISIANGMMRSANGQMKPNIIIRGWELLVQFKDEGLEWVKLKDLNEANLVELADNAVGNCLADKQSFKWWVPHVIMKRNWIINK
eukprot:12554254-Ditylum_brightwellii.AAC.1